MEKRLKGEINPELTSRELQVAALITAGLRNKEIAAKLNIGTETVNSHCRNIRAKAKVHSRIQIARWFTGHNSIDRIIADLRRAADALEAIR